MSVRLRACVCAAIWLVQFMHCATAHYVDPRVKSFNIPVNANTVKQTVQVVSLVESVSLMRFSRMLTSIVLTECW